MTHLPQSADWMNFAWTILVWINQNGGGRSICSVERTWHSKYSNSHQVHSFTVRSRESRINSRGALWQKKPECDRWFFSCLKLTNFSKSSFIGMGNFTWFKEKIEKIKPIRILQWETKIIIWSKHDQCDGIDKRTAAHLPFNTNENLRNWTDFENDQTFWLSNYRQGSIPSANFLSANFL